MLWFVLSYCVTLIGYLGVNSISSRMLGRAEFGYFAVALSITTLIGQAGLIGAHRSGLRDAARLEGHDPEMLGMLRNTSRAVGLVTLPFAGAVSGVATWFLVSSEQAATRASLSVAVGMLVLLSGELKLWASYLRGFGRIRLASIFEGRSGGAAVAVIQSGLLLALFLIAPSPGLPAAISVAVLGYLLPVLVAWRFVSRQWAGLHQPWSLRASAHRLLTRDWRFVSAQMSGYVHSNLELWIAGLLLPATATSLFSAADRLVLLLAVPLTTLQLVFAPVVARLGTKDPAVTQSLLRTGATLATVITAVGWIPMLVFPHRLLSIVYGSAFGDAGLALAILTVGYLANAVTGLAVTALAMMDQEGPLATVLWWSALMRLCLAIPAALLFGFEGLAASESIASLLTVAAAWQRTRALTGINTLMTLRPSVRLLLRTSG